MKRFAPQRILLPLLLLACNKEEEMEEPDPEKEVQADVQCSNRSALKSAYFGDLHTHTSYSLDAYTVANRSDPAAAYAFAAKGMPIAIAAGNANASGPFAGSTGPTATIDRKLDFLAVTDHSEWLQIDYGCTQNPDSPYYGTSYCATLRNQGSAAQAAEAGLAVAQAGRSNPSQPSICQGPVAGAQCAAQTARAWQATQQAAQAANNPCTFTSFIAYEWTNTLMGANLHRNVIFKDKNVPAQPFDYLNYPSTSQLWGVLSSQCTAERGCEALTIPHNSNASKGQMFVFSAADVANMERYQRLVEVHQHKGSSECLSDTADGGQMLACTFEVGPGVSADSDRPGYVRPALESGLSYYAQNKKNPLQLGFVAATDTHNSTPGHVKEDTWPGHLGTTDNTPLLRVAKYTGNCDPNQTGCQENANVNFNPAGITGVWAEQNTRESIWAALKRREVFGTSGPRIRPRFYAFSGTLDPCADSNFPSQVVQAGGVPMGGALPAGTTAPRFVVYALKDQTDLASVDIVKASISGGAVKEQVFSLTLPANACVTFNDPAFDKSAPAFYYARVLEKPTWRWSHYDCLALKQSNPGDWQKIAPGCASSDPKTGGLDYMVQERAWTSPIWYLP